jgi:hypothetical protein
MDRSPRIHQIYFEELACMRRPNTLLLLTALTTLACNTAAFGQQDQNVPMNAIQVIGTHNSYHAGLPGNEGKVLAQESPKVFAALNYHHPLLTAQLSSGVRQMELDIFADPNGGLYAHPYGPALTAKAGLPADPLFDPGHAMDKPGFKVMHVQDIDYRSNCQPFTGCLQEVKAWSQAHPDHLPIFLLIETKQSPLKVKFPTVQPIPFTPALLDALDKEILSVFSRDALITPDDVRGHYATLNEAVLAEHWPTLKTARGKIVFLMDQRDMEPLYTQGHPSLQGRILFTNAVPGQPDAAFTEENDGSPAEINALVQQGYLVRTRTDADTVQAQTNDTRRRDAVMASGAQILSTDYPSAEQAASGYVVEFPGNLIARCNPVLQPKGCVDSGLAMNHGTARAAVLAK